MTTAIDKKTYPLWLITQDLAKITFWIFFLLWHILLITISLDIKMSGDVIILISLLILGSTILLISIFSGIDILVNRKPYKPEVSTIFQKYTSFKQTVLRGWGMMFRVMFIVFIGLSGYYLIDPQSVGDTPFHDLSVRQFFSNLFAFLLVVGCIAWFFKFPKNKNPISENPSCHPYFVWGWFGVILIYLATMLVAYGGMLLTNL